MARIPRVSPGWNPQGFPVRSRSESHDAELSMQRKDLEALQKELWALKGAESSAAALC